MAFDLIDFAIKVDLILEKDKENKSLFLELFDFLIRDYPKTPIGGDNFEQKINAISAQLQNQHYVILLVEDLFELLTVNCEGDTFKQLKKMLPSSSRISTPTYYADSLAKYILPPPPPPAAPHYITLDSGDENELLGDRYLTNLAALIDIDDLSFFAVNGVGLKLIQVNNIIDSSENSESKISAVLQQWKKEAGSVGVGKIKPFTKNGLKNALLDGKLNYIVNKLNLN